MFGRTPALLRVFETPEGGCQGLLHALLDDYLIHSDAPRGIQSIQSSSRCRFHIWRLYYGALEKEQSQSLTSVRKGGFARSKLPHIRHQWLPSQGYMP